MKNFTIHAYLIECQSNLHVGSGDNNYGIVDKQVQRDTISNTPVIHASGLKGALREYFEYLWGKEDKRITVLFGSDKSDDKPDNKDADNDKKKEEKKMVQGALRFFEARLISIPVRGLEVDKDSPPFYRATSQRLIDELNAFCDSWGGGDKESNPLKKLYIKLDNSEITKRTEVETGEQSSPKYYAEATHIGKDCVVFNHEILEKEVFKHLPIIARNSLENGQSANLWYEEVVPRQSRFVFFVAAPDKIEGDFGDFNTNLDNKIVQIGANATVGYGYCKIKEIV